LEFGRRTCDDIAWAWAWATCRCTDAVTVAVAVPVASVPNLIKLAEKCSGMKLFVRPERERQTNSLR